MLLAAYICLLLVCVIVGVFYSILNTKLNVLNLAIKMLAILSCGLLAVVTANLSSAIGSFSLFVIIGFLILLFAQAISFIENKNTAYYYVYNVSLALAYLCFYLAALLQGTFNAFALIFGIMFALGAMLIHFAVNTDKKPLAYWISKSILFVFLGLLFGQGFAFVAAQTHLFAGVLYLSAGILISAGTLTHLFKRDGQNIVRIIANALTILGLIALASSVYFI